MASQGKNDQKRKRIRSRKAGLPAGALVHVGEDCTKEPRISVIAYNSQDHLEQTIDLDTALTYLGDPRNVWINVDGVHKVEIVEKICKRFGVHSLVTEDILNTQKRPKFEDYGDYLYLIVKMVYPTPGPNHGVIEQVSLIIGKSFVISFQEGGDDVFNPIRERLRHTDSRVRTHGSDYLGYALLDAIVDSYFLVLEDFGEDLEILENQLFANPNERLLRRIQRAKRTALSLRRAAWPQRELISNLERSDSPIITDFTRLFIRDIYDHTVEILDMIESFRETISGLLDIYLSSIGNRTNSVMMVLTLVATVFLPLTFIVGVYGMNFEFMPELHWRFGYPAVLLFMTLMAAMMVGYFKKRGWISTGPL